MFHAWTNHIEVHYHFIRERVLAGDVDLQHISTNLQTTDIFTKALGVDKLWQFMTDLGLMTPYLPRLRGSTELPTTHNARIPELRTTQAEARTSQLRMTPAEARISQVRELQLMQVDTDSGTQIETDFGYRPEPTRLELEGAC